MAYMVSSRKLEKAVQSWRITKKCGTRRFAWRSATAGRRRSTGYFTLPRR